VNTQKMAISIKWQLRGEKRFDKMYIQGDQKFSVHMTITVFSVFEQSPHSWGVEDGHHRIRAFGMWTVLYWTRSSRTQFGVSINVWRLAGTLWTLLVTFCAQRLFDHSVFSP
jgi:hypothetical protein